MRHILQWFIHLLAHSLRKGDEHPAYTARASTLFITPPKRPKLPSSTSVAPVMVRVLGIGLGYRVMVMVSRARLLSLGY